VATTPSGDSDAGLEPRSRPTVWRRADSAAYVESAAGSAPRVVALDLDRPEQPPYVFEGSAAQVWVRVDGLRSEDEIVGLVAEEFGVPVDVVAPDVAAFLARLRALGLVVDTGGG
jgi:Coenzyme PQQ synthesis protein D (PqqD)